MVYEFDDFVYVHDYGKARLYKGRHLIFKGNSWSGILMFLQETNNAPQVREMFKAQLEQREKPKDRITKKPKNEINEMPAKVEQPKPTPTKKKKTKSIWDDDRRMTK